MYALHGLPVDSQGSLPTSRRTYDIKLYSQSETRSHRPTSAETPPAGHVLIFGEIHLLLSSGEKAYVPFYSQLVSPTLNFPLQSTSQRPESRTIHSRGFESFLADRVRERLTKQKSKREKRGGEKRGGKKVKPGKGCAGMPIHNQHQSSSGGGQVH
ncbi:hypothetical protein BDV32DRAFT_124951 [Aspergillus pseudonomiae]|nr:hypothetical protein BDV32DRAFT_124951 [Aspergillus pseudonomiae]